MLQRFVALAFVVLAATPARADELPRVAVLNFKPMGEISKEMLSALSEKLMVAIRETGEYREVGESDFEVMLGYESFKQTLGCDDDNCLAEIAGAAGVGLLLTGTVIEDGGSYTVLAKLLDTGKASVIGRIEHRVEGGAAELFAAARVIVAKVFGRAEGPATAVGPAPAVRQAAAVGSSRTLHQALGWSAVGVGAAALVASGLLFASASSHKSTADRIYENRYQPADTTADATNARTDIEEEIKQHNSRLTLSAIALSVGVVAGGFGLFELLTLPEAQVTVVPAGSGVAIVGEF